MAQTITGTEYPTFLRKKAEQFFTVTRSALKIYDQLKVDYISWPSPHDARLAFFVRTTNHCNSTGFLLLAAADCIEDPCWWKRRVKAGTPSDLSIFFEETEKTGRKLGFLNGWAQMEACLRRVIGAFRGADVTGNITKCCEKFYKVELQHSNASEVMKLIRLLAHTRNAAVHHDFTYYPNNGKDDTIHYQGTQYDFHVGKQLTFFTWDFVHSRLLDLLTAYEETVRHPSISSLAYIPSR